ncbi:MAG: 3-dehydroquinate synthase [Bryobacterales bacterium]|nr:3-dehydroquinate synthase [Bryobacteraceae bacterium]MDW8130700.1 3-dehydroquinate synthase [Bryobacterales bacterium]
MTTLLVTTAQRNYPAVVGRGCLERLGDYLPQRTGKIFVLTTRDVWQRHATRLAPGLVGRSHEILFYPGGEEHKRLATVEALAEEMVQRGGDRSSLLLAFGGGIVNDVGGFLAAIFMRGIPVIQLPTTLLAQVDSGLGGKTGVNLQSGKNLVGAFHQPLAVLIDPELLETLPEREYRAGLFEVIKCAVIRSPELFDLLETRREDVLARLPEPLERMIAECVRVKAEVVSADERETDLRRILNFGHTFGHALEAETGYTRLLHGEAVGIGMRAATILARRLAMLVGGDAERILNLLDAYGPLPDVRDVSPHALALRLRSDKKTVRGEVHFVLPEAIGRVRIVSGVDDRLVREAIEAALS